MDESDCKPSVVLVGGVGNLSGVPRHITQLVAALQGHANITVISDQNEGGLDGITTSRAKHLTVRGLRSTLSPLSLWRGWRGLLKSLKETPADLVWFHARLPVLFGRLALALHLWRPKGAVAFTYHGLPFGRGHPAVASAIALRIEKLLLATCSPVDLIFLTDDMISQMRIAVGDAYLSRHRLHVLSNCSDLGDLPSRTSGNNRRLVMTGRAGRQKDYVTAARVFAELPTDFTLTLCGPGTEVLAFQNRICAMLPEPVQKRLHFAGPVSDVRPYLMAADAYLLTSQYEGLPIGTLEAFEAGLPIILRNFDGAQAMCDRHPASLMLNFTDLKSDAARIAAHVNPRPTETSEATRAVWQQHWSPDVFTKNAQTLLKQLCAT